MTDSQNSQSIPQRFDRFHILRKLGEGAMGTVYLAKDEALQRSVALKVPKIAGDTDGTMKQRLLREARVAASIQHRNICAVHDVGNVDGTDYICMAYIEGQPLSHFINAEKRLNARAVAGQVRKLALALARAHDVGIVHRDLKPANILIDRENEPVIMDFGLARRATSVAQSRLTQPGTLMGSPAYMSPEQIEGQDIGPLSDQYSLGVVLYELLCGRVPFEGPQTLAQTLTQEPPPPSTIRDSVDGQLEAICLTMLSKSPNERFDDMTAVANALSDYLRDPTASTTNGSVANQPIRTKTPRWTWPAVGLAFVCGFLLSASIPRGQPQPSDPTTDVRRANSHPRENGSASTDGANGVRVLTPNQLKIGEDNDLLGFIDVERDRIHGTWRFVDGVLTCESSEEETLAIPVVMEGAYDLTIDVRRTEGNSALYITAVTVESKPFHIFLDMWNSTTAGFEIVRASAFANETTRQLSIFDDGELHTLKIEVRDARVTVFRDEEEVLEYSKSMDNLTTARSLKGHDLASFRFLGIGANESRYEIRKLSVRPLE